MLLLLSLVAMFTIGLLGYLLGPLLPALQASLGLGYTVAGALFTVQSVGSVLAVVSGGILADRYGKKPVLMAGAAMLAVGSLLFSTAHGLWPVLVAAAVLGIGFGAVDGGTNAALTQAYPERSGSILNAAHSLFGAGALVGPLVVAALLREPGDFRRTFAAILALPVVLLVWAALTRFPSGPASGRRVDERRIERQAAEGMVAGEKARRAATTESAWTLLRQPGFAGMALFLFLYVGVEVGVSGWMVTILDKVHGVPLATGAGLLSLFWLLMTLGRLLAARIAARSSLSHLLLLGTAGAALSVAVAATASAPAAASLALPLTGLFLAPLFPTGLALGARACPGSPGMANGLLIGIGTTGGALLPVLMGAMAQRYGLLFALVGALAGLFGMLGLALLAARWERQWARQQAQALGETAHAGACCGPR